MKYLLLFVAICLIAGVSATLASNNSNTNQDPAQQEPVSEPSVEASSVEASSEQPTDEVSIDDQFEPIDNMHHFMEYVSMPSYKALKEAFAGEAPEGRRAWKGIKSHALILAETSAIVAKRFPEDATDEQKEQWQQISVDVYLSGKELYEAVGDFELAKKNYGLMIENCNKCHQVFDNGKHQLEK